MSSTKQKKETEGVIGDETSKKQTEIIQENKNGNAVAAMVLGIVSIVLFWIPYISITCGIIGIVLSVKGRKQKEKRSMATAGLVLSIIGLSIWALIFLITMFMIMGLFFFLGL